MIEYYDLECQRYSTEEEALKGHKDIVERLRLERQDE